MDKFYIFMILLVSCFSYDYNDGGYYRPRYATNRLSNRRPPFERTRFGRKPFGRTPFGRTPFDRPPFRHRLKMRQYTEKYYRDRSAYAPLAAWLRQKKRPEVPTEIPQHPNYSLSVFGFVRNGQRNASEVTNSSQWNWIARVVPTNVLPAPTICTAACVRDRIFITAAICIYRHLPYTFRFLFFLNPSCALSLDNSFKSNVVKSPAKLYVRQWDSHITTIGSRLRSAAFAVRRIKQSTNVATARAKVVYTRVVYQDHELPPIAFVLPSNETKEMFDDIGIIVVDSHSYTGTWHTIDISPKWSSLGRPDPEFVWHASPEPWHQALAVGYVSLAMTEDFENVTQDEPLAILYQLEVQVSNFLCNYLYNTHLPRNAYFVPCYSPCNLVENYRNLPKCYSYLSGLGHIVVWNNTDSLIGVATWAGYYENGLVNPPLPIGLSIANSDVFKENMECAEKIRNAPNTSERFDTFCT